MTVFKRIMTMSRPSSDIIFLGSIEDENQARRKLFEDYEKMRINSEYFRGAVFYLSSDQLQIKKVEIWNNQENYQKFIQEHREFISNLVKEYEEYCTKSNIKITRTHSTNPESDLTPEQKHACSKKSFIRTFL